jgi:hypothetical protein
VIAAGILTNSMIGATIENVTISNSSLDVDGNRAGVVSAITTGGTITNVTVSNVSIDCIENCGGLVGRSATAPLTITDSSVTGTLTAGGFAVGGFIGFSQLVTMSDSYTDVAINNAAGASGTGGIVGWHSAGCSATRMMALGDVTADGGYTGGAFGANYADVYEVVATGDVTATGSSTGGLIGIAAQGNIHDSLASGNVSGNNFGVGGLIGRLGSVVVADVQRNFSLSPTVTALDLDVGGAIGMVTDAPVIQDNFYWDNGVADVNATALVTGQLPTSANFINFIFPTTWKMTTAAPFGAPAIAPVPAWICTAAYSGVTCP